MIDGAQQVVAEVVLGIVDRPTDRDLSGQMEHDVRVAGRHDVRQARALNVESHKSEAARAVVSVCRPEIGGGRAGAQVVDSGHLVTLHQQAIYQGGADESSGAGDERAHQRLVPIR